ncbi:hypothetical protein [Jeongeupia wiesaeckerbachi]
MKCPRCEVINELGARAPSPERRRAPSMELECILNRLFSPKPVP